MNRHYLIMCLLFFFVGCGRTTTNSSTFRLKVDRTASTGDTRQHTKLTFHPPSKAEIIVDADGDKSSVIFNRQNPNGELESFITLAAERKPSPADGKAVVEILIRAETPNGTFAGGPSLFTVDADASLKSILNVTIAEGEFPLDEAITVGTLNGQPITLLVRRNLD